MTASEVHHRFRAPGNGLVAVALALLIGWAVWEGLCRNVLLDHPSSSAAEPRPREPLPDMRVDVNAASAAELSLLPGLGPSLAQRIVENRMAKGPFKTLEDVDRVPGIGKAIIERMRPYAIVRD